MREWTLIDQITQTNTVLYPVYTFTINEHEKIQNNVLDYPKLNKEIITISVYRNEVI